METFSSSRKVALGSSTSRGMWARCVQRVPAVLAGSSGSPSKLHRFCLLPPGCRRPRSELYPRYAVVSLVTSVTPLNLRHNLISARCDMLGGDSRVPDTPLAELSSAQSDTEEVPGEDITGGADLPGNVIRTEYFVPSFGIDALVNLLRQENGRDLCVIRLPPEVNYAEYFVVVTGISTRHIQAMAHYTLKVYKYLKKDYETHVRIEGKDTNDWMCIDFGNIVVHFMLPETRETYELEKLWTLRSYDDQLSQVKPEILPTDFMLGLKSQND